MLKDGGFEVRTAILDEPEHGLPDDVLDSTDVLLWWGHAAHEEVSDETVDQVRERVLGGMGLIVLHSGHFSKIFKKLMGTTCDLKWRHDDTERLWVVAPGHPIAEGLGEFIELKEEMYGEPFDVPQPGELVFVSWFGGGRSSGAGSATGEGGVGSSTSARATRRTPPTTTPMCSSSSGTLSAGPRQRRGRSPSTGTPNR
jgi:trehalose utilization protein